MIEPMHFFRKIALSICCASLFMLPLLETTDSYAHELKNNTVRVQLRDNHFRILIDVAVLDWLTQVGEHSKETSPTFDETQIPQKLNQARSELLEHTRLWADSNQAQLKVLHFPKASEIVAMLEQFARTRERDKKLPHGFGRYTVQLEGIYNGAPPLSVKVSFPESLGELAVNFEQPTSRLVVAGATAAFKVLDQKPQSPAQADTIPWTEALAWVTSLILLSFILLKRKSDT
jgi:hypothetical protein